MISTQILDADQKCALLAHEINNCTALEIFFAGSQAYVPGAYCSTHPFLRV